MTRTQSNDAWPTSETPTVVTSRDTLVGAPPPPPPAGPPPDHRIGWGMLFGLVVVALAALGILIAWLLTHRSHAHGATTVVVTAPTAPAGGGAPKIAVPGVVGLQEPQALARLAQAGLQPKEVFKPSQQPKGVVVSEQPKPATNVARGTQVTIVIDSGAPEVAVPDVRGDALAQAQRRLASLGLSAATTHVTSTRPAGTVVDEAPAPGGRIAKGSTITLSIAKAPPVTVPAVTGKSQQAAQAVLRADGLGAHAVTVHSQLPQGQVTGQHPAAGQTATRGSAVRINVSDGSKAPASTSGGATTTAATTTTATTTTSSQPASASVPDVTGQQLAAAAQSLDGANLLVSIQYIPGTDPLGTILQQSPQGGASAPARSHVTINASSGPSRKTEETVPSLVGSTLHGAVAGANGAHLRLIYLKLPVSARSQAGKVVQQTPLPGKQAPQNAQILVYLGAYR